MSDDTFYQAKKDVREQLREAFEGVPLDDRSYWLDDCHDVIFEIADSNVPVYTSTIMQYAAEDINLATDEPEIGPAFDGAPTPVNIVAANIYDALSMECWEELRDLEEEHDEFMSELEEWILVCEDAGVDPATGSS